MEKAMHNSNYNYKNSNLIFSNLQSSGAGSRGLKRTLILSGIVGFVVAILTRLSLIVFATDFSYIKIGNVVLLPGDNLYFTPKLNFTTEMLKYLGKKVVGVGGLPFSTFSKCFLEPSAFFIIPICDRWSTLREFSILLNTVFWGVIVFGVINLFSKIFWRGKIRKKLLTLIISLFIVAPAFGCSKVQEESTSTRIPVAKGNEIYYVEVSPNSPFPKKSIGSGNIIVGELDKKILALKGDYITSLRMEQISFPTGRTLIFIDPKTGDTEELIKDTIVIKAFPSHNGKYIAILTKDLHLGILNLDTKSFEVVFSDFLLPASTDYEGKIALAWSLDDSQIFFSACPKGFGTVLLNNDADLYMYDLTSKKATLLRGSYLTGKCDKFADEKGEEYIETGVSYIVLGVLDTNEVIVDYAQSGKVFEDGSTRDEEARIIAVLKDGRERVLWKLYEKSAPVTEGEFSGLYPLSFRDNKLLAVKVKMETTNGIEKDLMDLYLVEFQNGNPVSKKLLASNINSGMVAKFIGNGFIAYFNQIDSEVSFKGYWTIIDQNGAKIRDLPEGVLP